jgi:O-antigen/teichoic acid export membrane protein
VVALAPLIARHWVNPANLSVEAVESAVRLMGLVMVLQFPFSFYQGGLLGMQRQVLLNAIVAVVGTLRGAGAVLILWLVSPTIQAFFAWQVVVGALGTGACAFFVWRTLPASEARPRFRSALLRDVWRFAAAVSGNAIVGVFLTQIDKVVLSGMLSLEMFGYYALAGTVAASVWSIILPINTALFPRFAELTELRNDASLSELYHRSCQFLAVVLLPVSATLAFFSREIMLVWTSNPITADKTYLVVTLLVIGTTMNGLSSVGSYLLSASGWPQLVLFTNLASAILLVPGIVLMTSRFGAAGAAIIWMMLNSIYLLFTIPFMHRRLLKGEMWRWYREDVGMPLAGVLVFGGITRLLLPDYLSRWAMFGYIAGAWFLILAVTILLTAHVRSEVSRRVSSLFRVDYA